MQFSILADSVRSSSFAAILRFCRKLLALQRYAHIVLWGFCQEQMVLFERVTKFAYRGFRGGGGGVNHTVYNPEVGGF